MTKIRIPAMDIARRHPLYLKGTTDAAYARFASDLAELMEKLNIEEFKGDNLRELAIVLTMYYEDMISDSASGTRSPIASRSCTVVSCLSTM